MQQFLCEQLILRSTALGSMHYSWISSSLYRVHQKALLLCWHWGLCTPTKPYTSSIYPRWRTVVFRNFASHSSASAYLSMPTPLGQTAIECPIAGIQPGRNLLVAARGVHGHNFGHPLNLISDSRHYSWPSNLHAQSLL